MGRRAIKELHERVVQIAYLNKRTNGVWARVILPCGYNEDAASLATDRSTSKFAADGLCAQNRCCDPMKSA